MGGGVVCCNTFINLPAGCSGQHNIRLGSVAPPRLEGGKKKTLQRERLYIPALPSEFRV